MCKLWPLEEEAAGNRFLTFANTCSVWVHDQRPSIRAKIFTKQQSKQYNDQITRLFLERICKMECIVRNEFSGSFTLILHVMIASIVQLALHLRFHSLRYVCLKKRQTLPTQCLEVCANRLLCLKGFSLSNSITQIFAQGLGDSKSGSFIGNLKLMRGQITWPNRYGQKLFILHQLQQTFKNEFQFKRLFTQYDVIFCTILYLNFKHILKSAFEIQIGLKSGQFTHRFCYSRFKMNCFGNRTFLVQFKCQY